MPSYSVDYCIGCEYINNCPWNHVTWICKTTCPYLVDLRGGGEICGKGGGCTSGCYNSQDWENCPISKLDEK